MIWLTWRQFRAQTVAAAGLLAVLAIAFAVTGPPLAHLYDTTVATCHVQHDCPFAISAFQSQDRFLQSVIGLVMLAGPALIGIFWGAPLIARELEAGTQRLAWMQSVTRFRWLAVKLGLAGLASMAAVGLLSLMVTWWSSPFDRIGMNRLDPTIFSERGIVPVGYAAFAFALGVTAGLLIRRTVPAMAVTLAVFAAVQAAFALRIRFHLMPPLRLASALNMSWVGQTGTIGRNDQSFLFVGITPNLPGAWISSSEVTTAAGSTSLGPPLSACGPNASYRACTAAVTRMHLRQVIIYQPGSRFWAFQWYETAIYLALALALAGFCVWWVRRRVS
jgi:ABC-type transport system involved in multi-copper enzyme maturation permease subunit